MSRKARAIASLSSDAPSVTSPAVLWEALFGSAAPRKQPLIEQAVAWKEQVLLHGDVAPHIQRDLDIAARHVADGRGRARSSLFMAGQGAEGDGRSLAVGASCARERADREMIAVPDTAVMPTGAGAAAFPSEVVVGALARAVDGAPRARRVRTAPLALPPASSQLLPGTRLVKSHGGRNHVVEVTDDGFLYEGTIHASLSALAKHITGTHWNGLLFFGLRKRKVYPAKAAANG